MNIIDETKFEKLLEEWSEKDPVSPEVIQQAKDIISKCIVAEDEYYRIERFYDFKDLSDAAKEVAISEWECQDQYNFPFYAENTSSLDAFKKLFGVKISNRDIVYGNYYSLKSDADENARRKSKRGVDLANYIRYTYLDKILSPRYYSKMYYENGRIVLKSRKSMVLFERGNCPLTGYWIDNDLLDPIFEFIDSRCPDENMNLAMLIRKCLNSWKRAHWEEVNHYFSAEYLEERSLEKGMLFSENGSIERW